MKKPASLLEGPHLLLKAIWLQAFSLSSDMLSFAHPLPFHCECSHLLPWECPARVKVWWPRDCHQSPSCGKGASRLDVAPWGLCCLPRVFLPSHCGKAGLTWSLGAFWGVYMSKQIRSHLFLNTIFICWGTFDWLNMREHSVLFISWVLEPNSGHYYLADCNELKSIGKLWGWDIPWLFAPV